MVKGSAMTSKPSVIAVVMYSIVLVFVLGVLFAFVMFCFGLGFF